MSSLAITLVCLATLTEYWSENDTITTKRAWECIAKEKEKADAQRNHAHGIFAREKDGACDGIDDDANDAHYDYEHRIKRRRGKRVASSAAALTDIIEKESNNAMAASSSSSSSSTVWMRTPLSLPNMQQMTTSKSGTGAMARPTGTDPAAPDLGHVPVAQASQALQAALSAAMDGSHSRGTVTITQVIAQGNAEPTTQFERADKIRELLDGIEEPHLLATVLKMVQTRMATIRETMAAKSSASGKKR